jgi:hypothetical protein
VWRLVATDRRSTTAPALTPGRGPLGDDALLPVADHVRAIFRDEQGELLRAVVSCFVRSPLASGGRPLGRGCHPPRYGSTLERSEELAEAPREESERDGDRQRDLDVRRMLGRGRRATSHGAGIDIASPQLKSP